MIVKGFILLALQFYASFFILFEISIIKYIVSNGVGKMNVCVFPFNFSFLKLTAGSAGTRTWEVGKAEGRRGNAVAAGWSRGLSQSLVNGLKILLVSYS